MYFVFPFYHYSDFTDKKDISEYNYPPLKYIGFDKILKPEECYLAIENHIAYKEPDTDSNPNNMDRFISKGFDKKESFRKPKKDFI